MESLSGVRVGGSGLTSQGLAFGLGGSDFKLWKSELWFPETWPLRPATGDQISNSPSSLSQSARQPASVPRNPHCSYASG